MLTKKNLLKIINGVISELVILNESYLDEKRLFNAIEIYFKNYDEFLNLKQNLKEEIDKALLKLYISRRILPDVVNGKGYIIAINSDETLASANELYERTVSITSPAMVCLPIMLYSTEDAKKNLNHLSINEKRIVDDVTRNYIDNLLDSKNIFPEFE